MPETSEPKTLVQHRYPSFSAVMAQERPIPEYVSSVPPQQAERMEQYGMEQRKGAENLQRENSLSEKTNAEGRNAGRKDRGHLHL